MRIWRRRKLMWGLIAAALLALSLGVAVLAGGLYLSTPAGNERLRVLAEEEITAGLPGGSLAIERLQTDLLSHLEITGIVLSDADGAPLVELGRASLRRVTRGACGGGRSPRPGRCRQAARGAPGEVTPARDGWLWLALYIERRRGAPRPRRSPPTADARWQSSLSPPVSWPAPLTLLSPGRRGG